MAPSDGNPLPLVRVVGPSMSPTLRTGDVVLVRHGRTPAPVISCWSGGTRPGQLSIKRAVRRSTGWHVEGDNPFGSTDSRTLGAPRWSGGRYRLWPRPRGWGEGPQPRSFAYQATHSS
ncbi:S26 family signal peptidase [Saccharothrix sp. MB29]|nr:S26 family signal peptidase [Saccharothrix sp. MB29]